jgi:hypothetical protein
VLRPLDELVHALNHFSPALLAGYSTVIAWLAEQQAIGALHMRPLVVVTTSEWTSPVEHDQIGRNVHCSVRDLYAATEFLGIATTCAQGALHANTDWLLLESVDAVYRPVPAGQPSGTVLLTNLATYVQPLIRYDLGDRITTLVDRCPCGSARSAMRVEGRQEAMLRFQRRDSVIVPVTPLALTPVASELPGVLRYHLSQTASATVGVRMKTAAAVFTAAAEARMVRRLTTYLVRLELPVVKGALRFAPPGRAARTGSTSQYRTVFAEPAAHLKHARHQNVEASTPRRRGQISWPMGVGAAERQEFFRLAPGYGGDRSECAANQALNRDLAPGKGHRPAKHLCLVAWPVQRGSAQYGRPAAHHAKSGLRTWPTAT